ncbi:MAG TPA: S8 family serine peptidase [Solirubrobacterales bacterium]|nr:S8 family serine peptidase [Solirubrobacterales bacterium]
MAPIQAVLTVRPSRLAFVRSYCLMAVTLLLAIGVPSAQALPEARSGSVIPGHYIVVLKDSIQRPAIVANEQVRPLKGRISATYRAALKGYAASLPKGAAGILRRDPRVVSVTPDHQVELQEEVELEWEEEEGIELSEGSIPTGVSRVFAPGNKALDLDKSDDLRANVDVAVIDSGIEPEHPDLYVAGRVNCVSGSCVANTGTDTLGHGTHVAGTIGAIDNGIGVVGVAPGARLWAVKAFEGRNTTEAALVAAANWVVANASTIEVANASFRCICSLPALETAVNSLAEAGVVFVAAAGNDGINASTVSPAKNSNAITVSAIADYDGKAGGLSGVTCENGGLDDRRWNNGFQSSNYGSVVDIAAPGTCIVSTVPGKTYNYNSGTSMAAPHVAGAAAILAAQSNPNSKADAEAIRTKLINAGNKGWTDTSGDGIQEPLLDVNSETTFWLPRWIIETTPNASGAEHSALYDMACEPESTSACTAVGKQTASGGTSSPYAQYWNGSSWSNQSTETPVGATSAELQADHCLSKTSCVAAGSYTTGEGTRSLVEVWNGTKWTIQETPKVEGKTETRLKGVSCKEITACIAVGYSGTGSASSLVAMRGNSGVWSLQTVPLPTGVSAIGGELTGVDCVSTTSCTAVGRYYTGATTYWGMIATWNGTTWTSQVAPKPAEEPKRSTLLDISCSSSSSCTAVGGYTNKSSVQVSFIVKWNGTSWSHQTSPNPTGSMNTPLQNVSCAASSPCVAVGDWLDASEVWRPMAQYWNGTSWVIETSEVPTGNTFGVFEGVACRTSCLTIGWYKANGKDKTLGETRKWPS